MLFAHGHMYAAEDKKYNGWFNADFYHAEHVVDKVNDCAKDRLGDVKELEHQAFDRAELLQVIMRDDVKQFIEDDVNKLGHNVIVDLTQNITKAAIASSLGIGAVIAFYQAAKAAITIACAKDEQPDKKEYITMYSCAGAATLCATCSLFCYWSIN